MKFVFSISMSFLILFQGMVGNMDFCEQIKKISGFFSHYQEHKEIDGYSFLQYIYEDYIEEKGNSDDHERDSQHKNTPVHFAHNCCQYFVFYTPFHPILKGIDPNETQNQFIVYQFRLNSAYPESLFQPPQVLFSFFTG